MQSQLIFDKTTVQKQSNYIKKSVTLSLFLIYVPTNRLSPPPHQKQTQRILLRTSLQNCQVPQSRKNHVLLYCMCHPVGQQRHPGHLNHQKRGTALPKSFAVAAAGGLPAVAEWHPISNPQIQYEIPKITVGDDWYANPRSDRLQSETRRGTYLQTQNQSLFKQMKEQTKHDWNRANLTEIFASSLPEAIIDKI